MFVFQQGSWLGIDVGSNRDKVCNFCLIESAGAGSVTVRFEKGPARAPYPSTNTKDALLAMPRRPPVFFKPEIEAAVTAVLDRSVLLKEWIQSGRPRKVVAIDAPVAFAADGESERLTETACTQTFKTPSQATFQKAMDERKVEYHRINTFWKCVGLCIYRHLAHKMALPGADNLEATAAATVAPVKGGPRLRETFPSDVYKCANGRVGTLKERGREVLRALVADSSAWRPADSDHEPAAQTMNRLREIATFLREDLDLGAIRLCEMNKKGGTVGDFWDAFTCAFAACCEDHDAGHFHGANGNPAEQARLRREGAILTVAYDPRAIHAP